MPGTPGNKAAPVPSTVAQIPTVNYVMLIVTVSVANLAGLLNMAHVPNSIVELVVPCAWIVRIVPNATTESHRPMAYAQLDDTPLFD
jgi:hypothetical protein